MLFLSHSGVGKDPFALRGTSDPFHQLISFKIIDFLQLKLSEFGVQKEKEG